MYRWDYRHGRYHRRHHGWGMVFGLFLLAALFTGGFKVIGFFLMPLFLIISLMVIFGVMRFAFATAGAGCCEPGKQKNDWWQYADQYTWKSKRKNDELDPEESESEEDYIPREKRKNEDIRYI